MNLGAKDFAPAHSMKQGPSRELNLALMLNQDQEYNLWGPLFKKWMKYFKRSSEER